MQREPQVQKARVSLLCSRSLCPEPENRGWENVVRDKDKYTEPDYFVFFASKRGQGRVIEKVSEQL